MSVHHPIETFNFENPPYKTENIGNKSENQMKEEDNTYDNIVFL